MNNKGFTLIELLAVIIVLAIVSSITIMAVNGSFSNAKIRSEKVFINNVTKAVDAYIAENMSSGWGGISSTREYKKYDIDKNECTDDNGDCKVSVSKREFEFKKVIDSGYLKEDEIVNPNDDNSCYDDSTMVQVYRDSDYVYCFMVKLGCLEKKMTNSSDKTETSNYYSGVINTCPFNDNSNVFGNYYYTVDIDDKGKVYSDIDSKVGKNLN